MNKVLILDANQRSALAATRSLGNRGLTVTTADEHDRTLSGSSKYCSHRLQYPSPATSPDAFIDTLACYLQEQRFDLLLPMTDITTELVLKNRHLFGDTAIPFPDYAVYESVTDKAKLFDTARRLDVPIPATRNFESGVEAVKYRDSFDYPVVLKPFRSRISTAGGVISTAVSYAHTPAELQERIGEHRWLRDYPLMVQQYIRGRGQGMFVLCDHGRIVAAFAHRRLRERPPTGGVSVLSESVPVPPRMLEIAEQLLSPLPWHGVAMVEFKVSEDNVPYLMEVNGRFWGSLQLAIDSGVDFPWLLYQVASGEPVESVEAYRTGVKCRWLLGDLDHLYLKMTSKKHPYSFADKLRSMGRFALPYMPGLRYEVNRLSDFKPFLFELKRYFFNN